MGKGFSSELSLVNQLAVINLDCRIIFWEFNRDIGTLEDLLFPSHRWHSLCIEDMDFNVESRRRVRGCLCFMPRLMGV